MRAAALSTTTPDARSLSGRASDGAPRDEGFDNAMADLAQAAGSDAGGQTGTLQPAAANLKTAKGAATGVAQADPAATVSEQTLMIGSAHLTTTAMASGKKTAPDTSTQGGTQDVAALLAKLANGSASAGASVPTTAKPPSGDASATGQSKTGQGYARDDAATNATAVTDPVAAMAALLPGLVAAPTLVAAFVAPSGTPSTVPSRAAAGALVAGSARGGATAGSASGVASSSDAASGSDTPEVGLAFVASSTYLAPAPAAPATLPRADVPAGAKGGAKASDTALASAGAATASSTTAGTDTPDATPIEKAATHAEPTNLPAGTLQALAGSVTSLADTISSPDASAAPTSNAAPVPDPTPTQPAPGRSLTLQLTPGDLGSVTVRLHLTAGGLDVHLAVEDQRTLTSISHARDDLTAAIGNNGYRVESLVIRGSDASSTSTAGSNDSARSQSEAGAGQGSSGGGSGQSGGDGAAARQRAPQPSPGQRGDSGGARRHDGVFV